MGVRNGLQATAGDRRAVRQVTVADTARPATAEVDMLRAEVPATRVAEAVDMQAVAAEATPAAVTDRTNVSDRRC